VVSGEREGRVAVHAVGRIRARDAAAASVTAGQRAEVEPGLGAGVADGMETAAARGTRDRRRPTVADDRRLVEPWGGGVDHPGFLE
jgi:hypothetical protein